MEEALGAQSKLVAAGGGIFEISVDGETIFSKRSLGRFPNDGEVLKAIQAR